MLTASVEQDRNNKVWPDGDPINHFLTYKQPFPSHISSQAVAYFYAMAKLKAGV